MPAATLLAALLLVAPALAPPPPAPRFTPSVQEYDLAGVFRLRTEVFLQGQPVFSPLWGWNVQLSPTTRIELSPNHPHLGALALSLTTVAPTGAAIGTITPALHVAIPRTSIKAGVALPILAAFSSAGRLATRAFRPMLFVTGRF